MLIDRRSLLRSWQALLAAVAALSAIPAGLVFVFGARVKGGVSDPADEWIDMGPAGEVTEGPWMVRKLRREILDRWKKTVVEESVYLRRRAATIEAVSASCTHTGCLVRHVPSGFACLCHRSEFDDEGKPKAGPAPRPLDRLETKVEGERLLLRFVKFRPGLSHSEPMVS
jgi:Rieske Fe-S protein